MGRQNLMICVFLMDLYAMTASTDSCPSSGSSNLEVLIPHPSDCSLFYRLDKCPDGLHFNPQKRICDWPSEAKCSSGGMGGSGGPAGPGTGGTPGGIGSPGSGGSSTGSGGSAGGIGSPGSGSEAGCPSVGSCPAVDPLDKTILLPHRDNCSLFCTCDHGSAKLTSCPSELHFNPKLMVCDWPIDANCMVGSSGGSSGASGSGSAGGGGNGSPGRPPSGSGTGSGSTSGTGGGSPTGSGGGSTEESETGSEESQGECLAVGKCPEVDPLEYTIHLPHQTDCNRFCVCDNGIAKNKRCPDGLHFNPILQVCDWPLNAKCKRGCEALMTGTGSSWSPKSCVERPGQVGEVCNITCQKGYELKGSDMLVCTNNGWNGTGGLNIMPACKTPEDLGEDFVDKIATELKGKDAGLLFVLDESGSVSKKHFALEITFIKALVSAFPLSARRSAGVITFSDVADVDILLSTSDTCKFLAAADRITYRGGNTDIQKALSLAIMEMETNAVHNKTLVFLVTDGVSSTNPSAAAQKIRADGNVLFTVGIAQYDRNQLEPISSSDKDGAPLFYGVTSFQVFNTVASYLDAVYNNGTSHNCITNLL